MSDILMPKCPHCSQAMVLRAAGKGHNKGKQFYGCSRFPRCKGTRPLTSQPSETDPKVILSNPNEAITATKAPEPPKLPLKEKRPLTDQQRKELIKLHDRLLNLSSQNRSIRLNRLSAKWTFDLGLLNPFGNEAANELLQHSLSANTPKSILPKPIDDQTAKLYQNLSARLTQLFRAVSEIQREKGLHDFYIGFPFISGIPLGSETVIQAPVFLLPVTLEKSIPRKGAPGWTLTSFKDMPVVFNKTLFLALSKMCNLTINPNLFEEEIPKELYGATSLIQKTHELLNEYGIRCDIAPEAHDKEIDRVLEFTVKDLPGSFLPDKLEVCQYAVLGHFPQSNSSLLRDYDKFLEFDQNELDSLICFLSSEQMSLESELEKSDEFQNVDLSDTPSEGDPDSLRTIDDRKEQENFLLLPSDSSQDRIILELSDRRNTGMVIWGPPGTGKSQTIVNLIGDCLARGKSVLLVSQKRAALDVVYDRLSMKNLTNLVGLVHDSKSDRKQLYEKINQETAPSGSFDGRPENAPMDPSGEIEKIGQTLKDVFKAYNDDSYGVKLGELYRKLGGRRDTVIPLDSTFWKTKRHSDLSSCMMQLRILQGHVRIESNSSLIKNRKSFSQIKNHEKLTIKEHLDSLTTGEPLLEAFAIISAGGPTSATAAAISISTARLLDYTDMLMLLRCHQGIARFMKLSYWKTKFKIRAHLSHAKNQVQLHGEVAKAVLPRLLDTQVAQKIIYDIAQAAHDRHSLKEFAETFSESFNELKSYDIALESLTPELRQVAEAIEKSILDGKLAHSEDWGNVFERSVLAVWASDLEPKHAVITLIRSGQVDALREQYKTLLKSKADYCVYALKRQVGVELETSDGSKFKREINADVNRSRNRYSIRKLNEKFIDRSSFRAMLPVWLVSPEVVSDIFPLQKGLFDVVIFDEASQCKVEHGLPAIYRGKQVIIAGDEKQLPPSSLFESTVDEEPTEDENAHATEEPSLLSLAKKTFLYKSHMLEWHYRSKHQELITFSNEVFYSGRMKIAPNVIPFKRGNRPAIAWHAVSGFWEDRTNREEALKVIERMKYFLSQEEPSTVGVITFNAPQKELILDLIDKICLEDPEFNELLQEDKKRPIDSQLFVKNIENVQGDEREVILFSVAYARSEPNGRVNQNFGSLNSKGGENRLNVAITRAIKRVEIVASIDPERDLNVSMSANAGPKILRNYLRFANAVASEDFDRSDLILREINSNVKARETGGANITESPFEDEVLFELQNLGFTVHTQVGQSGFRIDMAVVHPNDAGRYLLGIECDGAMFHSGISVRERDVFRQKFLEDRKWTIHRIWSTNWWDNKDKEIRKLREIIESLLRKTG